jgi:hypothetical protein
MFDGIIQFFTALFTHAAQEHPEGIVLYTFGAITITIVHLVHRKEFVTGLKGKNGLFEAPEICIYLFTWLFPHMIMADQFVSLHPSNFAWYFMAILLLFGLTGRFGLEWLLAIKNGGKIEDLEDKDKKEDVPPKI